LAVVELNNEALKPADHHPYRNRKEFDPCTLLQLQILFEQLVLAPIPPSTKDTTKGLNSIICDRLPHFKKGRLRELYKEAHLVQSKTPKQQAEKPVRIQKAAQAAEDVNNFKSATARVKTTSMSSKSSTRHPFDAAASKLAHPLVVEAQGESSR
jgi:hypothetical protein